MNIYYPQEQPRTGVGLFSWLVLAGVILMMGGLTGCGGSKYTPPPVVEVSVPVPVPCKIQQVPEPEYPKAQPGDGLYRLTQVALADRQIRKGDQEKLRAANQIECVE